MACPFRKDGVTPRSGRVLTCWLSDLMFGNGSNVAVRSSGNTVDVVF